MLAVEIIFVQNLNKMLKTDGQDAGDLRRHDAHVTPQEWQAVVYHDDVIKWSRFPHFHMIGPSWGESIGRGGDSHLIS